MKTHTQRFKELVKQHGREIDSKITYSLNDKNIELGEYELNSITPHYQANILKSVMKQLDLDSNVDIPVGTIINYKFGVKIDGTYEYLNFGNYIVYSSEKQEDLRSYKIICYDKMLNSMKPYEKFVDSYPITINDYIDKLCKKLNLTFKSKNDNYANKNKTIDKELYLDADGNSLDYTYRDVLDELAQVTASTIVINENTDELEIRYINDTNDTIDDNYLKDVNVNFNEKYGPINSIVLSRSAGSDNVFLRDEESVKKNGLHELKISDNQIMNFDNRSEFLNDILQKLNGLEYYINDYSSTGIMYYDVCDKYKVNIGDKVYTCIMFNDEADVTQGLEEKVYTEMPEETETDYVKADKTDRKINQTSLIVDKQNQIITATVEKVDENTSKIGQLEIKNDEISTELKTKVSDTELNEAIEEQSNKFTQQITDSENNTKSELTKTINTAKTEAINSANTSTDNKLKNYSTTTQMNNAISQSITASENKITSQVSNTYITKTDSATNIGNAKTEAINSANKSTDEKLKNYSTTTTMNNTIEQKITESENSINLSVTNKINNIQVGERNYILNSDTWVLNGGVASGITQSVENGVKKIVSTSGNGNWNFFGRENVIEDNFKNGDQFTFAIEIKSDNGTVPPQVYFKSGMGYYPMKGTVSKDYSWCYYTGVWKDTNSISLHFGWGKAIGTYYIRKIMFVRGNKVTDWSPAPEDKLNTDKFTKAEIVAEINNGVSNVKIYGENIILANFTISGGKLTSLVTTKYNFTQTDVNKVKELISKGSWTTEELNKYDINKNGKIDSIDYIIVKGIVDSNITPSKPGKFEINTTQDDYTHKGLIYGYDGNGNEKVSIGLGETILTNLNVHGTLTSNGDANFQNTTVQSLASRGNILANGDITAEKDLGVHNNVYVDKSVSCSQLNCSGIVYSLGYRTIVTTAQTPAQQIALMNFNPASPNSWVHIHTNDGKDWGFNVWASDKRLKEDIADTKVNALDIISKIKHHEFRFKNSENSELVKIGYVADELQEIDKNFVFEVGEDKMKQISSSYIIPFLSKAIQEQQEIINEQQKQINELLKRVSDLEKKL